MNRLRIAAISMLIGTSLAAGAQAANVNFNGKAVVVWGTNDLAVITLDVAGPCGSKEFAMPRDQANFRETFAIGLAAVQANKRVSLWVDDADCDGANRARIIHGGLLAN